MAGVGVGISMKRICCLVKKWSLRVTEVTGNLGGSTWVFSSAWSWEAPPRVCWILVQSHSQAAPIIHFNKYFFKHLLGFSNYSES